MCRGFKADPSGLRERIEENKTHHSLDWADFGAITIEPKGYCYRTMNNMSGSLHMHHKLQYTQEHC